VNTASSESYRDNVLKMYKEQAEYPPHKNFRFDLGGQNITGRYLKQNEMYDKITHGNFDQDTIDQYISSQKENGIDGIVSAVQKQLDEWRKTLNEEDQQGKNRKKHKRQEKG